MFDIGFLELVVVAVVVLLVVGPERMPEMLRHVSNGLGKARRFTSSVQEEFKREMHNADILQREAKGMLEKEFTLSLDENETKISDDTQATSEKHDTREKS